MSETTLTEKPPISIWKRLLLASAVFVLLLTAGIIVQYYLERSRNAQTMQEMLTRLDESDPNWRLDEIEETRPSMPDGENSAVPLMAAYRLLPRTVLDYKVQERFDGLPPPELLDAERLELLEKELASIPAVLAEARRLADMPSGRHTINYLPNPIAIPVPQLDATDRITGLLQHDALHLAQKGNTKARTAILPGGANAARSLDDEPFIISHLFRIANVHRAASAVERTLALGEPPLEDLASLQKLAAEEETHAGLVAGLRGVRAILHIVFTGVANGSVSLKGMFRNESSVWMWRENYARWTLKSIARREHPRMMELMSRAIDNARLPLEEQMEAEKQFHDDIKTLSPDSSLIRLLLPATEKFAEASLRKIASMRCLQVVLALEQHRQTTGKWPGKLEELTPKLLAAVPNDPFDDKRLRDRRLADGVVVYSIGPDKKDDGGSIRPTAAAVAKDVGYQLWDPPNRRQPPKTPAAKPK